jgi:intracellular multiplication protein IcmO
MALDSRKYEHSFEDVLRDTRPVYARIGAWFRKRDVSVAILFGMAGAGLLSRDFMAFADIFGLIGTLYIWWLLTRDRSLPFKMPMGSKYPDPNNGRGGKPGKSEGILYLGNVKKTNEEVWFTNSDARTHLLYLGTTGAGKTEGLKSMVTNALSWGSGFVYVDGKADTDLWSSLSALCRRFGRDDDLLVLNYMTGNQAGAAPSNTMNPFSSGSASYLVNMLTNLMPDAEGDNVMWKERAVSLVSALMPALVWKRDQLGEPLYVTSIRDALNLNKVIALSREEILPAEIRRAVEGYLDTLPGYQAAAFDDMGQQKPPGPDVPQVDMNTMSNQHGFLTMQLTRSLQSLGEDYGYIFNAPHADVDMNDVVLNRRVLVVLIPALEKSGDEIANLGKIIAANMKGMMGSALGATVEGDRAAVIDNKPATSSTPFMTVFDEVGYYTAQGMAVMAAQARSLGFCLVFSGQDLPAMKKRVREEANSITANCNLKIFGKLEDPTETKEFFEKTVGQGFVTEVQGFSKADGAMAYFDSKQASVQLRPRASYDGLREFKEGEAVFCFSGLVYDTQVFYSNPGHAKAMRVTRFIGLGKPDETTIRLSPQIRGLRDRLSHKKWTAKKAAAPAEVPRELALLVDGMKKAYQAKSPYAHRGHISLANMYAADHLEEVAAMIHPDEAKQQVAAPAAPAATQPPASPFSAPPQGQQAASPQVPPVTQAPAQTPPASPFAKTPPPVQSEPEKAAPPPTETAAQDMGSSDTTSSDSSSGSGGAPSIFGGAKKEAAPVSPPAATTPPPAAPVAPPVQQTAPPPAAPPPVEKPAEAASGKPSIFGSAKTEDTPVQQEQAVPVMPSAAQEPPSTSPPAPPVQEPVKEPVKEEVPPAAKSSAAPLPELPKEVDDILTKAANDARKVLKKNNDIEAAE